MFAAIHAAKHYLYLEYYTFEDLSCNGVQLERLLMAKAQEGVRLYLIYDGIGSLWTPIDFFTRLQNAGIQVVQFNPPNPLHAGGHFSLNDRDHRKTLIAQQSGSVFACDRLRRRSPGHKNSRLRPKWKDEYLHSF